MTDPRPMPDASTVPEVASIVADLFDRYDDALDQLLSVDGERGQEVVSHDFMSTGEDAFAFMGFAEDRCKVGVSEWRRAVEAKKAALLQAIAAALPSAPSLSAPDAPGREVGSADVRDEIGRVTEVRADGSAVVTLNERGRRIYGEHMEFVLIPPARGARQDGKEG